MLEFSSIKFERNKEYLIKGHSEYKFDDKTNDTVKVYKIGSILFSILDTDWSLFIDEIEKLFESLSPFNYDDKNTLIDVIPEIEKTIFHQVGQFHLKFNEKILKSSELLYWIYSHERLLYFRKLYTDRNNSIGFLDNESFDINSHKKASKLYDARLMETAKTDFQICHLNFLIEYFRDDNFNDKDYFSFLENKLYSVKTLNSLAFNYLIILYNSIKKVNEFSLKIKKSIECCFEKLELNSSFYFNRQLILNILSSKTDSNKKSEILEYVSILKNEEKYEITVPIKVDLDSNNVSYFCEDICSLVLLELNHLCEFKYSLKKCELCGGYFIPFNSKSVYCDRIYKRNKTCKEIGPKSKYNKKIENDSAIKLYNRNRGTFQMRYIRNPEYYKKAYNLWCLNAKSNLKEFKVGKITFEEFEDRIKLPPTK